MTIQEGNINKHLDDKPPKDKWFIWCLTIIIVMIAILLTVLFKPEIFTNVLDTLFPPKEDETSTVEEYQDKKEEKKYSDNLELINVDKEEALYFYDIAYDMSKYLKNNEYYFESSIENKSWKSIYSNNLQYFPIWFTLNMQYNKSIPQNKSTAVEMELFEEKLVDNKIEYQLTNKQFQEHYLIDAFHVYFQSKQEYVHQDRIEYMGCYLAVYNEEIEGYAVYQNLKSCSGSSITTSYQLVRAESETTDTGQYLYLYETNGNNNFMYTLIKEDGTYRFALRSKLTNIPIGNPNEESSQETEDNNLSDDPIINNQNETDSSISDNLEDNTL